MEWLMLEPPIKEKQMSFRIGITRVSEFFLVMTLTKKTSLNHNAKTNEIITIKNQQL